MAVVLAAGHHGNMEWHEQHHKWPVAYLQAAVGELWRCLQPSKGQHCSHSVQEA